MKYCKKCGTLLEDTIEVCIGCGTDVSDPENVSKYPPYLEKKLEAEKKQNKTRTTTIIAIIVVFVLLLALVCLILFMAPRNSAKTEPAPAEQTVEEVPEEEPIEEAIVEEEVAPEDRNVKDDQGSYYSVATLNDEGGNTIFTGLYPEDFNVTELSVDYTFCSNRLPGYVTFIADDADNTVRFIYFSPQHFWNKQSENRKSFTDGQDPIFQMTFATYDEGATYVENLIKKSYPDAKRVELMETWDARDEVQEQLSEIAKAFKKQINTHVDYAHIGSDTAYAPTNSESIARFYRYEVQTKDKSTLFLQFYVPLICNKLIYSSDERNDRGTMIEWMSLGVYGMVAGNEDLYDDYAPAFEMFMDNCDVNKTFYRILEQRCEDLKKTIEAEEEPPVMDAELLGKYKSGTSSDMTEFDTMLYVFTTRRGGDQIFILDDTIFCGPSDTKVAFVNREKQKVFLSPAEDEYPGSGYEDMELSTEEIKLSADDMESVDDIAAKEEEEKKKKEEQEQKDDEEDGSKKDKDKDKEKDADPNAEESQL